MGRSAMQDEDIAAPSGHVPKSRAARLMMRLMRSRYAYPALFVGVLIESTIFPWPVEFVLAAMMLDGRHRVLPVALIAISGSIIGAVLFFVIGAYLFESWGLALVQTMGWEAAIEDMRARFRQNSVWVVVMAAQTPLPFQFTAMAAGAAGVAFWPFVIAALLGRTARYGMMAIPVYYWGPAMQDWWARRPALFRQGVRVGLIVIFLAAFALPFL